MSEDSDRQEKDEELEALLKQLVPTPLNVDLIAALNRDQERIAADQAHGPAGIQWSRVIPLTLVGSLAMVGLGFLRYGDRFSPPAETEVVATPVAKITEERFVPVSAHGFLMNASSGGVIETEEGPRERLNLEYRDAYHWHDPDTGTNIRYFQPRNEEVIVPLQTD